ncbi:MAG: methylated-DNA--[protein]-cysteine S-methyltransferase [Acetobacteraceae bacterium]
MNELHLERTMTPTGRMLLVTDDEDNVRAADWEDHEDRMLLLLRRHTGGAAARLKERRAPSPARRALEAYFGGELAAIDAVAVRTEGTAFQREVWAGLRRIPVGGTVSYGELAARIGRPKAVRAVGLANGSNPISVIVPCHRVIGADASLTGYGGGLERKHWLLAHEGVDLSRRGGGLQLQAALGSS